MVNKPRVRQSVAMVHTTPLNGRAPNASALRSDYRYTSSPPDNKRAIAMPIGLRGLERKVLYHALVSELPARTKSLFRAADCCLITNSQPPAINKVSTKFAKYKKKQYLCSRQKCVHTQKKANRNDNSTPMSLNYILSNKTAIRGRATDCCL